MCRFYFRVDLRKIARYEVHKLEWSISLFLNKYQANNGWSHLKVSCIFNQSFFCSTYNGDFSVFSRLGEFGWCVHAMYASTILVTSSTCQRRIKCPFTIFTNNCCQLHYDCMRTHKTFSCARPSFAENLFLNIKNPEVNMVLSSFSTVCHCSRFP